MSVFENNPRRKRAKSLKDKEHISDNEEEYIKKVQTKPIKFKTFDDNSVGGGLVIGLLSLHKLGKSIAAMLWGYYHSDFKKYMGPKCQKMLSQGTLPEIEKIIVVDTEVTVERDLKHGIMRTLMKPLIDAGRIIVVNTPLKRKKEGLGKDGKITNLNEIDLDAQRENFENAVWSAVDKYGENCEIVVDSTSDYKKALDDLQEVVFGKTVITSLKRSKRSDGKAKAADAEPSEALQRSFWQYRNKWWHNCLIELRTSNSWVAETFKIGEVDDQYRAYKDKKTGEWKEKDKFYPIWCKRTQFRIDQGYTILDDIDLKTGETNTYLRFDWGKYEHTVPPLDRFNKEQQKTRYQDCYLLYPQHKRMAMMTILEDMAPCLLGEVENDEALW